MSIGTCGSSGLSVGWGLSGAAHLRTMLPLKRLYQHWGVVFVKRLQKGECHTDLQILHLLGYNGNTVKLGGNGAVLPQNSILLSSVLKVASVLGCNSSSTLTFS